MRVRVAALVLALALAPRPAAAAPLLDPHVGGPVFTGPTAPHVSAIFWNPAAAGLTGGIHFLVQGVAQLDQLTIDRATISSADGEPAAGGDRAFDSSSTLPLMPGGFIGLTVAFGDRFTLGFAHHTAYAQAFPDDAPLAYHARGGWFVSYATTATIAVRASRSLYAGFGMTLLNPQFDLRFDYDPALTACAAPPCDIEDPANARQITLKSHHDWHDVIPVGLDFLTNPGISYDFGLLVRLYGWWIGASYISRPVSDGDHLSRDADATVVTGGTTTTGSARVNFKLPSILSLGLRRPFDNGWDLLFDFQWIDYSVHDQLDVRLIGRNLRAEGVPEWMPRYRGFQDVFSLSAGIENQPGERVRLGARLRFETSAVPSDTVAPEQVDAPKIELAVGTELRLTQRLALVAGYSFAFLLPRSVDDSVFKPSSQITCTQSGFDLDTCAPAREGRALPTAAGDYSDLVHRLSVAIQYDVW